MAIKDGCSIGEIQERYTTAEIRLWAAWERLNGPVTLHERLDVLFARSDLLQAEMNRNKKKRKKPFKLKSFLMNWDRTDKPTIIKGEVVRETVREKAIALRDKFVGFFE